MSIMCCIYNTDSVVFLCQHSTHSLLHVRHLHVTQSVLNEMNVFTRYFMNETDIKNLHDFYQIDNVTTMMTCFIDIIMRIVNTKHK